MDELIVLFMREFGWSLEYTLETVGSLPIRQLNAIANELRFQRRLDEYNQLKGFAMLASIMTSTGNKKHRIHEFIGQPPQRKGKESVLSEAAAKAGIKLPGVK